MNWIMGSSGSQPLAFNWRDGGCGWCVVGGAWRWCGVVGGAWGFSSTHGVPPGLPDSPSTLAKGPGPAAAR